MKVFGPVVKKVSRMDIPKARGRGREAFIKDLPFWASVVQQLSEGLNPSEAIEIELKSVKDPSGKVVSPESMESRIRHQFRKAGFAKRYSLLAPKNSGKLFIVDHKQTVAA